MVFGREYPKTRQKKGYSEELDHVIEVLGPNLPTLGNLDSGTEVGRQNIRKARSEVLKKLMNFTVSNQEK